MSDRCVKCKTSPRFGQDTWCVGCGAWEAIGRELTSPWGPHAGLRRIADDIILNCARETRALRGISAGLGPGTEPRAGATLKEVKKEKTEAAGEGAPQAQSKTAPTRPSEAGSEYTYEEESSEESQPAVAPDKTPRPALPRHPGQGREDRREKEPRIEEAAVKLEAGSSRASGKTRLPEERSGKDNRREDRERKRKRGDSRDRGREKKTTGEDKKEKKRKRKNRRGGRRHQRLYRLQEDPHLPHHRKLSSTLLDERPRLD